MTVLTLKENLAAYIDQTKLDADATEEEMKEFLEEAKSYGFYGAAVMPFWVPLAARILQGSSTRIVAAIGYPLGTIPSRLKVQETKWVIQNAGPLVEVDMVMNIASLKSCDYQAVREDIEAVVHAAEGKIVKVIIETPLLKREEIVLASLICKLAGASFVKTSTGFKEFRGWRPTTLEDIKIIKEAVGAKLKIKAAGGIRTLEDALAMINAGVSRIGTSSGVSIMRRHRELSE